MKSKKQTIEEHMWGLLVKFKLSNPKHKTAASLALNILTHREASQTRDFQGKKSTTINCN